MNFISREEVMAILDKHKHETWGIVLRSQIESLPSFPAPNPTGEYDRNIMGQTEDEFWAAVDRGC